MVIQTKDFQEYPFKNICSLHFPVLLKQGIKASFHLIYNHIWKLKVVTKCFWQMCQVLSLCCQVRFNTAVSVLSSIFFYLKKLIILSVPIIAGSLNTSSNAGQKVIRKHIKQGVQDSRKNHELNNHCIKYLEILAAEDCSMGVHPYNIQRVTELAL